MCNLIGETMRTTAVDFDTFASMEFQHPANFYVRTALGYIYIHTRKRDEAQRWVDNEFGVNKYLVRSSKLTKGEPKYLGHSVTAK